jgi:hypothetical protein
MRDALDAPNYERSVISCMRSHPKSESYGNMWTDVAIALKIDRKPK